MFQHFQPNLHLHHSVPHVSSPEITIRNPEKVTGASIDIYADCISKLQSEVFVDEAVIDLSRDITAISVRRLWVSY